MKIKFTKMHGAGNDFVVLDCTREPFSLTPQQLRFLADRHFGIGADQILVVEPAEAGEADFKYRIFNADGGEVEQCGNGARCFVKFVYNKGLTEKKRIRAKTIKGVIELELKEDGMVRVSMGTPSFEPSSLPFNPQGLPSREIRGFKQWAVRYKGELVWFSVCSMGNPHVTIVTDDIESAPVKELGPFIENHPAFPRRVNVGFIQPITEHEANVRVWERGAGETLACGTGNCAAAATSIELGVLSSPILTHNRGGDLRLAWEGEGEDVELFGPAVTVFDSEIEVP